MRIIISSIFSKVDGSIFPAISFVPAKITTTDGLRLIISVLNRTNICEVVGPAMPRLIYSYQAKKNEKAPLQSSVIEYAD